MDSSKVTGDFSQDELDLLRICAKDTESYTRLLQFIHDKYTPDAPNPTHRYPQAHLDIFYRAISQSVHHQMVMVFDHELRFFIYEGNQVAEKLGYTRDVVLGHTLYEILSSEAVNRLIPFYQNALLGQESMYELEFRGHYFASRFMPLRDDAGKVIAGMVLVEEITARKEAEIKLRQSEELYRLLMTNLPKVMVMVFDLTVHCVMVHGESLVRRHGLTIDDLLFRYVPDVLENTPIQASLMTRIEAALHDEDTEMEQTLDGYTYLIRIVPIRDEKQSVIAGMLVAEDITERKRAESLIKRSEELYRLLARNIPNSSILMFDRELRYVIAEGRELLTRHGYDPDHLIGKRPHDVMSIERAENIGHLIKKVLEGQEIDYEFERDGYFYASKFLPVRQDNRQIIGAMTITEDITLRKQAETLLKQSEERFRQIYEISPIGMALVALDGRLIDVNASFADFLGYTRAEMRDLHVDAITPPEDIQRNLLDAYSVINGEVDVYRSERRYMRKDSVIVWGFLAATVQRDAEGNPLHFVSQIQDITEARLMREQIEAANARYNVLVSNVPAIAYTMRGYPDGRLEVEYVSPRIHEIHRITPDEVLRDGTLWMNQFTPESNAEAAVLQREANVNLTPFYWEACAVIEGEERWFRFEARPTPQHDGTILWNGIEIDITAQKRLQALLIEQEKLRASMLKERELSELKTKMMRRISHEFRTPLAIIQTSTEILDRYLDNLSPERRREHIRKINAEIERTTSMIEDIRLIVQGQHQQMHSIRAQPVTLEEVIERSIKRVQDSTHHTHPISIRTHPAVGVVMIDENMVATIIENLLHNAVKYSAAGAPIEVELSANDSSITFTVSDRGIGIPSEEQTRIFEPFFRASNIDEVSGLGLGLTLVKDAVEQHGGKITFKSVQGVGSAFTVTLNQQ